MTSVLRLVAFAIAVAALIDPTITVSGVKRPRLAIVVPPPASRASDAVRRRLARDLSTAFEVVSEPTSDLVSEVVSESTSDPAAAVLIGNQLADIRVPDSLLVATVTMPEIDRSGARIVRLDAPGEIPRGTAIPIEVELQGRGLSGRTTDVTAAIAGLEVGRVSHRWTADDERWRSGLDVVPVGEPPYAIRVRLQPDTTGPADATTPVVSGVGRTSTTAEGSGSNRTVADVAVDIRRTPFRVEFYDPRPSWVTTFVRRALESDARFQVAALTSTSRGIFTRTGGAVPLSDPRLDGFDVVIVGGLDRLTAAETRSLDRYMRERGGAVVVLPDQRIDAGSARDLILGQELNERLLEQPATLTVTPPAGSLRASELLAMGALPPGAEVIARIPGAAAARTPGPPVIASMPRGDGRLLLSGAMDAWRFRAADNGAFDRFWQSTIAGLALAVPPPIAISVEPPLLEPGTTADIAVRVRSRDIGPVSAVLDRSQPIRLFPDPEAGVYRGRFETTTAAGRSMVEVRVAGARPRSASRTLLTHPDVHRARPSAVPALNLLASSHRGIDVAAADTWDLERFLRVAIASPRAPLVRRPMRSAWWMLPFAVCLSAEWWLRRRRGLR